MTLGMRKRAISNQLNQKRNPFSTPFSPFNQKQTEQIEYESSFGHHIGRGFIFGTTIVKATLCSWRKFNTGSIKVKGGYTYKFSSPLTNILTKHIYTSWWRSMKLCKMFQSFTIYWSHDIRIQRHQVRRMRAKNIIQQLTKTSQLAKYLLSSKNVRVHLKDS